VQFLFKSTDNSWRFERKCEWVFFLNTVYIIRPLIAVVNVNVSLTSVTLNCESWYIKSIGLRIVTLLQSTNYKVHQIINYHKAYMSKCVNTKKLFHFLDKLGR